MPSLHLSLGKWYQLPKCEQGNSTKRVAVKIVGGLAETSFEGLVSAHHDENGNGKIDKNAVGIALEGVGIYGNPAFVPLAIAFAENSFVMTANLDPIKHIF